MFCLHHSGFKLSCTALGEHRGGVTGREPFYLTARSCYDTLGEAAGGKSHGSRDCVEEPESHEASLCLRSSEQVTGCSSGAWTRRMTRKRGEQARQHGSQNRLLASHGAKQSCNPQPQILSEGMFQPFLPAAVTYFIGFLSVSSWRA